MLGDLKFCSMFVFLCLSVCFRNVGCWHVLELRPVAFSQGSRKKIDQDTYLTGRLAYLPGRLA